jgi:hypothetical protein
VPLVEETPDPLETVQLLKSDFEALQKIADFAVEDCYALAELLGVSNIGGLAPREFFHTVLLPKVARLLETQSHVDQATLDIKTAAARHGNQTKDFGNGVKGLKIGQRITDPELLGRIGMGMTRAERRRIERDQRRG